MKVDRVKMTSHPRMVNNKSNISLNTDIKVQRIPSRKEFLDSLVKTYGEKELKRLGVLECKTCAKRNTEIDEESSFANVYKEDSNINTNAGMLKELEHDKTDSKKKDGEVTHKKEGTPISICPECGRKYVHGGAVDEVKVGDNLYGPSIELFEGIKMDERI